jgi:hypothetical protein
MQKCQISIFIIDPPSGSPFGEALAPQGDPNQKMYRDKKFLELDFRGGGSILCQKSKISKYPPNLGGGGTVVILTKISETIQNQDKKGSCAHRS